MIDMSEISDGSGFRRTRRRVLAGEGMVTPRKPMAVAEDGKVETLIPRQSRLTIEHPLVRRNPEKFDLCWDKDHETRARLREYHKRALRHIERQLGERPGRLPMGSPRRSALQLPTSAENNYGLGPSRTDAATWRLP